MPYFIENLARGSMGEQKATRESLSYKPDEICMPLDDHFSVAENVVCLFSFRADNLMYVHGAAFCYNNCKFGSALGAALKLTERVNA